MTRRGDDVFPPSDDMKRRCGENSMVSDGLILQTENIDQHTFVPIVSLAKNKEEGFGRPILNRYSMRRDFGPWPVERDPYAEIRVYYSGDAERGKSRLS
jgi:DNA-directed RNA polymerase subunit H (RpoH/RPB5)